MDIYYRNSNHFFFCLSFINRDDVDFDTADSYTPVQEFDLVEGSNNVIEYGVRITKFTSVRNIILYFPENFGEDTSIIRYIGFKGEWTEVRIFVFIKLVVLSNVNI